NFGGEVSAVDPILTLFKDPAVDRPGRLSLITGRNTFSAASLLVARLDRDTGATVVGEEMGGCPTAYGNPTDVTLPSSRLLASAMRDGPLTPSEYAVYSAIFELESASPTALAGRLGMRLTTFMDHLRLVEGRGHARRLRNPRDGRSYLVTLTAGGLDAHRAANRQFEAAYAAFIAGLDGGE